MTSSEISPLKKALQSGAAGFGAMSVQVTALMWLRTTVNYQYRHGGTGRAALRRMYPDAPKTYRHCVVTRWGEDPFRTTPYPYTTPRMEYRPAHKGVGAAVAGGRVSFAGEACSLNSPGTVHGAYSTGVEAAKRLLDQ